MPPEPGSSSGNYQAIALISKNLQSTPVYVPAASGAVSVAVDASSKTYTLTFSSNDIPVTSGQFSYAGDPDYGSIVTTRETLANGATRETVRYGSYLDVSNTRALANNRSEATNLRAVLLGDDAKPHYATFAQWNYSIDPASGPSESAGRVDMVFGTRTPASGIPLTGTAKYTPRIFTDYDSEYWSLYNSTLLLTADFSNSTIAAAYDFCTNIDARINGVQNNIEYRSILNGSAAIGPAGDFSIGLTGTSTKISTPVGSSQGTSSTGSAVGSIAGAFFGPQAQEIGAIFSLPAHVDLIGGDGMLRGALVATQN